MTILRKKTCQNTSSNSVVCTNLPLIHTLNHQINIYCFDLYFRDIEESPLELTQEEPDTQDSLDDPKEGNALFEYIIFKFILYSVILSLLKVRLASIFINRIFFISFRDKYIRLFDATTYHSAVASTTESNYSGDKRVAEMCVTYEFIRSKNLVRFC
jgi:hypothetical protein